MRMPWPCGHAWPRTSERRACVGWAWVPLAVAGAAGWSSRSHVLTAGASDSAQSIAQSIGVASTMSSSSAWCRAAARIIRAMALSSFSPSIGPLQTGQLAAAARNFFIHSVMPEYTRGRKNST